MNEAKVKKLIEFAKKMAQEEEYKSEIFSAVMTAGLMSNIVPGTVPKGEVVPEAQDSTTVKKKLSIREFLISKGPKNDIEKTVAYAYYMENFEGKTSFKRKDLIAAFRASKEIVPKNPDDKIQQCIRKGWMTKAENKGEYALTNTGMQAVEKGFSRGE